ncbi:MAG: prepilin-type N-terminal cleavage/methylation domain-containing protein [Deltaproteobacteria bacterium]|nr:MAG: prepilin-type N-terminal cleavage/methylation domain-containing protein [Deltaproteobacteria bacterium]
MVNGKQQCLGGFTLIEIMVAITILAIIMSFIYTTFTATLEAKRYAEDRGELYQTGWQVLNRITRELEGAYLVKIEEPEGDVFWEPPADFIGKDDWHEGNRMDTITFTTMAHRDLSPLWRSFAATQEEEPDSNESEHAIISYFCRVGDYDDGNVILYHQENAAMLNDPLTEGGGVFEMAERVQEFRLRYYDEEDKEWKDRWDWEVGDLTLPLVVEVTLTLQDKSGHEGTFSTLVDIPGAVTQESEESE